MKETYTKKQIKEAIAYWQKRLDQMNEDDDLELRPSELKGLTVGDAQAILKSNGYSLGKIGRDYELWENPKEQGKRNPVILRGITRHGTLVPYQKIRRGDWVKITREHPDLQIYGINIRESIGYEGAAEDVTNELVGINDIPNYVKAYIKEQILQDAGHDGVGYHDWDIAGFAQDLLDQRELIVSVVWNDGSDTEDNVMLNGIPFKFSFADLDRELARRFPDRHNIQAILVELNFNDHGLYYCAEHSNCFDDPDWRNDINESGFTAIKLDDDGNASAICVNGNVQAINSKFDIV